MKLKLDKTTKMLLGAIALGLFLMSHKVFADKASPSCNEALRMEEELNKTYPQKVDNFTEIVQLSVNCDTSVIKYTKRILAYDSDLAKGWRIRKQRQHNQLHCNNQGLASKGGWTAMDVLFDKDYKNLVTLKTSPSDCK